MTEELFLEDLEERMIALLSIPPMDIAPEPFVLHCPVCQMTRERCLLVFGRDPVHEMAIREALAWQS